MESLYLNHNEFMSKCKYMKRRKQNHKISFHFFAGSPHPPRRKWIGKEIFGFGLRPKGARGAHCSLHHTIRAYGEVQSHHALRACEVSCFATGRKFGFHHIDGATKTKNQQYLVVSINLLMTSNIDRNDLIVFDNKINNHSV